MARNMGSKTVHPKLVVFDLDYTLWPFWVDSYVYPPFRKTGTGDIKDSTGKVIGSYDNVVQIFEHLRALNITIGVASRTGAISYAHELVNLLGWERYIAYREIYPGSKIPHFQSFNSKTGIPYSEMVFFDDEYRNIKDVSKLGVTCIHAKHGMSMRLLHEGLNQFAQNSGRS